MVVGRVGGTSPRSSTLFVAEFFWHRCCLKGFFSTTKRLRFANQPNKRGDKWESRGVGQENVVLFVGAESGSVLVFVEVKLLVGFGFCKSLKVGILYRTYEKVSRPGPCNFNGDPIGSSPDGVSSNHGDWA